MKTGSWRKVIKVDVISGEPGTRNGCGHRPMAGSTLFCFWMEHGPQGRSYNALHARAA
jgi:hypothetical protein